MSLDPAALESAIRAGDGTRARALLRAATEADRRACANSLKDFFKAPEWPSNRPYGFHYDGPAFTAEQQAEALAGIPEDGDPAEVAFRKWQVMSGSPVFVAVAVGVAGGLGQATEALTQYRHVTDVPDAAFDVIAGVLADRHPHWLPQLINRRLSGAWRGLPAWPLARRLIRLGAIPRPDIPEYTTQLAAWTISSFMSRGPVLDGLLDDQDLLDDEVWRLFTTPGAEPLLRYPEGEWSAALATLADRGRLDRDRLLDACLDAFVRDFPANRVGWYLECHDRLAPALDEMAARTGKYLALLAATSKTGVTLGQRGCAALLDAGRLDTGAFLAASPAALAFPQKAVATAQLRLLGKLAARDPAARDRVLATAAEAFTHPREDVQQTALALIARHGVPADPAARAAVATLADSLSPVLVPDATALGLLPAPPAPAASSAAAGAPSGDVQPAGARDRVPMAQEPDAAPAAAERLVPVTDPAELVQLLAQLIEDASDALAVERTLAGAVRLASLPLTERTRLAGPLLKRAGKIAEEDWSGPFSGRSIRADLATLAETWATGQLRPDGPYRNWWPAMPTVVSESGEARKMAGLLTARIAEARTLIAAATAPVASPATATSGTAGDRLVLLAEPEFTDGTIGHATLLSRLARLARPGTRAGLAVRRPYDLGIALLRLARGASDEFWAQWAAIDPYGLAAARAAYTESGARLRFSTTVDGPNMPSVTARVHLDSPPVSHCWRLLTEQNSRHTVSLAWTREGELAGARGAEIVAAWPLLVPHRQELIAAQLLRPLSAGLEPGRSAASAAVAALAPPGRRFGQIGHLALVTGLASAEPDTRITAAETWTRVARDGRLAPARAAEAITKGVTAHAFKLNRLAEALKYAALDPATARSVADTAILAAADLLPAKPANLHLLLELAARAVATASDSTPADAPAPLPPALVTLASSRTRTKLSDAARRLSQLTSRAAPVPSLS